MPKANPKPKPQIPPGSTIKKVALADLKLDERNARKHSARNLDAIKKSLTKFGQQKPIVILPNGKVIAGNGTVEAARALGWTEIDAAVTNLNARDAKAYALADNRSAELAEWDVPQLSEILEELRQEDFDLSDLEWNEAELRTIFGEDQINGIEGIEEDEIPKVPKDPVTKMGDVWVLGRHRIICGNSSDRNVLERLGLQDVELIVTSPPYCQQRDYDGAAKDKLDDWESLMTGVFGSILCRCSQSAQIFVNLGLIHRDGEWIPYWNSWIEWMREHEWRRFGWYVWDQGSGLPGDWNGRCAPSFEFVFHFNRQAEPRSNPESSMQPRKIPDSVIRISRENRREETVKDHPARYPVEFAAFFLRSWYGDVCDPFLGSGTTLIACEHLNRTCYGIEISPAYCDVIIQRWQNLTGGKADRGS
ncbi:MAG TPA: site-specific DNA-methyltransferase [Terrimicrobiaceae bacterium]|nr:site-specific DNA-methyltransferase [Terrimicrobiaceae bacterium]